VTSSWFFYSSASMGMFTITTIQDYNILEHDVG